MGTDFFDDDLLRTDQARRKEPDEGAGESDRPSPEAKPGRLTKQKQEMTNQMAVAAQEIESLQLRQQALNREKQNLTDLSRRQDEYVEKKRSVVANLQRGLTMLEKEETRAARMSELFSVLRKRFREALDEVRGIDEETWGEDGFEEDLNKAAVVVDDADAVYRKGLAKVDASGWDKGKVSGTPEVPTEQAAPGVGLRTDFLSCLKTGLALALPLMVFLVLLYAAHLFFTGMW